MIRKLKNILNKDNCSLNSASESNFSSSEAACSLSHQLTTTSTSQIHSSPVNFIKKKIKSSKSWVKIPKTTSIRSSSQHDAECIYATVEIPELASGEFEAFTRTFNTNASSLDYGFESRAPSLNFHSPAPSSIHHKHSTIDSHLPKSLHQHHNINNRPTNDRENFIYFKVTQRLKKASFHSPAHIPLICCRSFRPHISSKWVHLIQMSSNLKLLEVIPGMAVNALFYSTELDIIYAQTADEREGYVPRDHCKPVVLTLDAEEKSALNDNDSIKYHSLSSNTDYENLGAVNSDNNNNGGSSEVNPYAAIVGSGMVAGEFGFCPVKVTNSDTRDTRDSGYRSDVETNNAANDYEVAGSDVVMGHENSLVVKPFVANDLENMKSRSRVPISISNSSDLTVMNEKRLSSFANPIYKSPRTLPQLSPSIYLIPSKFQRGKIRRSLDSNLILGSRRTFTDGSKNGFQAVEIDIDETSTNYNQTLNLFKKKEVEAICPDLDIDKIEQDSMTDSGYEMLNKHKKVWTVISRYDAKNSQEMSVVPGQLVVIVREYKTWLYIKVVESQDGVRAQQMYGFVPRGCIIDLQDEIEKNENERQRLNCGQYRPRRSLMTAL